MNPRMFVYGLLAFAVSAGAFAKDHDKDKVGKDKDSSAADTSGGSGDGLKNEVVLIIRHAEKPDSGDQLAPAGVVRANRYPDYFEKYTVDSKPMKPDYLFAAADSKGSERPVLTITPTSKALGLKIDERFKDADYAELADALRAKPYGKCILICWHHGEIPQLVTALGGDASKVIPDSKWPGSVFNWVIQMRYDDKGKLSDITKVEEGF